MNEEQLPPGNEILSPPAIAPERLANYFAELGEIQVSDEQKLELLATLYSIMRGFVELGFDVGSLDLWGSIVDVDLEAARATSDSGIDDMEGSGDDERQQ